MAVPSSALSLFIGPNPLQDLDTLSINFIAFIGKYQNQNLNSGIASTAMLIGAGGARGQPMRLTGGSQGFLQGFLWPLGRASTKQLSIRCLMRCVHCRATTLPY